MAKYMTSAIIVFTASVPIFSTGGKFSVPSFEMEGIRNNKLLPWGYLRSSCHTYLPWRGRDIGRGAYYVSCQIRLSKINLAKQPINVKHSPHPPHKGVKDWWESRGCSKKGGGGRLEDGENVLTF